jgi:hypothetical protein
MHFTPRADQPEKYDEQTAFYQSQAEGVAWLLGGNGCTIATTAILDPVSGISTPIAKIAGPHRVYALNPKTGRLDVAWAKQPYQKGVAPILSIRFSNGQEVSCTAGHWFLTVSGKWVQAGQLHEGDRLLAPRVDECGTPESPQSQPGVFSLQSQIDRSLQRYVRCTDFLATTCESVLPATAFEMSPTHALSLSQTAQDSQDDCLCGRRFCDELPQLVKGIAQECFPSPAGVLARNHADWLVDDQGDEQECIHGNGLLFRDVLSTAVVRNEWCDLPLSEAWTLCGGQHEELMQLCEDSRRSCTSQTLDRLHFALNHPLKWAFSDTHEAIIVTSIEPKPPQPFYDFEVPGYGNYWLAGGISANSGTTTCLVAKICRFVLETPPPRRDTPFWVISESYQQCGSMFDEKFDQQGHLPDNAIDRKRIQWHKVNNNWPFRVPLKSPPGHPGKNWCLEFKSWRQGRGQMQARSLGGFGFIEQFPWGVFEEVLRGCREYNFPGSKLVEYTPVDPDMSIDIEEMLNNGKDPGPGKRTPGLRYLPHNWEVYHANTACAAEAGHVDMEWFKEFFGMVPSEMLDVRMKGLFASFEGTIYKEFNPSIHCMGDEMWSRIRDCQHRRGIDWGAGPENDFVCFDDKMQVLTDSGWKYFADVSMNDQIMTMDMESEKLQLQHPTAIIAKPWDGEMITSEPRCEGVGFSVTPDHEIVVRSRSTEPLRKVTASHFFDHRNIMIPTTSRGCESVYSSMFQIPHTNGCKRLPDVDLCAFAEFLGLYIAEGCLSSHKTNRHVCIAQKTHMEQVVQVLDALGWKYWKSTNNQGGAHKFTIASTALYEWIKCHEGGNKSRSKRIPRIVFTWPIEAKRKFLSGLELGDGRKRPKNSNPRHAVSRAIFSTSEQLANDIQELAVHCGIASKIHCTHIKSGYTGKDINLYKVGLLQSKHAKGSKLPLEKTHYTGIVRCVSVPNGTLIVRRPGHVPFVCGNCLWGAKNSLGQWFLYDEYVSHDQSKTTIDHLEEVYHRWEWPEHDKKYGMTYADPSSPDNIRIASKLSQYVQSKDVKPLQIGRGRNAVIEGIEHLQYLLKPQVPVVDLVTGERRLEPKLFIHRSNCPTLVQQMKTYRWERGSGGDPSASKNPKDARRTPLKFRDHTCDAARYLMFTDDGRAGLTISSAKAKPSVITQSSGVYLPDQGALSKMLHAHRQNREGRNK